MKRFVNSVISLSLLAACSVQAAYLDAVQAYQQNHFTDAQREFERKTARHEFTANRLDRPVGQRAGIQAQHFPEHGLLAMRSIDRRPVRALELPHLHGCSLARHQGAHRPVGADADVDRVRWDDHGRIDQQ